MFHNIAAVSTWTHNVVLGRCATAAGRSLAAPSSASSRCDAQSVLRFVRMCPPGLVRSTMGGTFSKRLPARYDGALTVGGEVQTVTRVASGYLRTAGAISSAVSHLRSSQPVGVTCPEQGKMSRPRAQGFFLLAMTSVHSQSCRISTLGFSSR